jgi:hypothetical protein
MSPYRKNSPPKPERIPFAKIYPRAYNILSCVLGVAVLTTFGVICYMVGILGKGIFPATIKETDLTLAFCGLIELIIFAIALVGLAGILRGAFYIGQGILSHFNKEQS